MCAAEESERWRVERARRDLVQRIEDLKRDVELWHKSERIRAYLGAFRERMERWSGPIDAGSETAKWLSWANLYADQLDPLNPSAD